MFILDLYHVFQQCTQDCTTPTRTAVFDTSATSNLWAIHHFLRTEPRQHSHPSSTKCKALRTGPCLSEEGTCDKVVDLVSRNYFSQKRTCLFSQTRWGKQNQNTKLLTRLVYIIWNKKQFTISILLLALIHKEPVGGDTFHNADGLSFQLLALLSQHILHLPPCGLVFLYFFKNNLFVQRI